MNGVSVFGEKQGLHGDKTTTGAICNSSIPSVRQGARSFLREGDTTTPCPLCGQTGKIAEGVPHLKIYGKHAAVHNAAIACGCPPGTNRLIAGEASASALSTSGASREKASPQAKAVNQTTRDSPRHIATAPSPLPRQEKPERLKLPARIFVSQGEMDNHNAEDMRHGDLSEADLKSRFQWAHSLQWRNLHHPLSRSRMWSWVEALRPDKFIREQRLKADAKILFDRFRSMSTPFSWLGPYRSLMTHMINHMQANTGTVFRHALLDKALAEHQSLDSSLREIRIALEKKIAWEHHLYPAALKGELTKAVHDSGLPKFDSWINRVDGMGITVHDTAATEITLKSLDIQGNRFLAEVHYRVQDHFGLDDVDIAHRLYGNLPLFQTWYVLQRWEGYNYRPFITEMTATRIIEGLSKP